MKYAQLENLFKDYVTALSLTEAKSHHDGEKYITAPVGSVHLGSCNSMYAIMIATNENGAVTPVFGYYSSDRIAGYMEQAILSKLPVKKEEAVKPAPIDWTRVNNDSNGNPRYVCHFLNFITDADSHELTRQSIPSVTDAKYWLALKRAKKLGGRKFHNKQYGGGIVFQSYNISTTEKDIQELMKGYL